MSASGVSALHCIGSPTANWIAAAQGGAINPVGYQESSFSSKESLNWAPLSVLVEPQASDLAQLYSCLSQALSQLPLKQV